jgi:hypothetical protein
VRSLESQKIRLEGAVLSDVSLAESAYFGVYDREMIPADLFLHKNDQ